MPSKKLSTPVRTVVNFEFDGHELTAEVGIVEIGKEIIDLDSDDSDWELEEVFECIDSVTGEKIKVTEGVKAAIVLALRERALKAEEYQEREVGETGHSRYFKPSNK